MHYCKCGNFQGRNIPWRRFQRVEVWWVQSPTNIKLLEINNAKWPRTTRLYSMIPECTFFYMDTMFTRRREKLQLEKLMHGAARGTLTTKILRLFFWREVETVTSLHCDYYGSSIFCCANCSTCFIIMALYNHKIKTPIKISVSMICKRDDWWQAPWAKPARQWQPPDFPVQTCFWTCTRTWPMVYPCLMVLTTWDKCFLPGSIGEKILQTLLHV